MLQLLDLKAYFQKYNYVEEIIKLFGEKSGQKNGPDFRTNWLSGPCSSSSGFFFLLKISEGMVQETRFLFRGF